MLYIIIIALCIILFAILFVILKPFMKLFLFSFYRRKLKKKENEYKAAYRKKLEYNKDAKENPAWYKFHIDLESEDEYIKKYTDEEADNYVNITTFVVSLILTISGCIYFYQHHKDKQIVQTGTIEKQSEVKTIIVKDAPSIDKISDIYKPVKNVINVAIPLKKISKEKGCKACKNFMDCAIQLLKIHYGKSNNPAVVSKCRLLKDQSGRNEDYGTCMDFQDFEKQKWTDRDHELTQKLFSEYTSLKCQPIHSTKCQKELMIEQEQFNYSLYCGKQREKFYLMRKNY